ncbi:beta-phosphoglucomutase [Mycoplasma iguanae]|uniref:Beta-phosphoglucomutase n=1 Tax=Mycoplasma iguanae TaxID=292461 RepID=A0ABY5RAW3_9MOLU|nr:beta-phosphoglucomutase [Mycoplasma iguanae]UVD81909.1 beta-phosphoglucomutase [Mycoplasma iguanae]
MIKGLIFDLDGVITETATLHFLAWKEIVKEININFTEEENSKLKGLSRIDTLKAILKLHKKQISEQKIVFLADKKNEFYKELLNSQLSEKDILPGIVPFLNDAKKHNLKMIIASSSFNAQKILEKIKLNSYFDGIVDPSTIKNGKPAPDIFLAAAKLANLKPEQCIGFEDALAGVEGLKAANIFTIALTHNSLEDYSKADLVFKSTNDLNLEKILSIFKSNK